MGARRYYTPADANHAAAVAVVNVETPTNTWQIVHPAGIRVGPELGRDIKLQIQDAVPAQIVVGVATIYAENPAGDKRLPICRINLAAHPAIAAQNDINQREVYSQTQDIPFGYNLTIMVNSAVAGVGANTIARLPVWEK